MAGDAWTLRTVDELKAPFDSAISIGPFGSRMKSHLYTPTGVPVIRGNNISDTKALAGDFVFVSEGTADQLKSSNALADDLVFPHRGAIGEVGIVPSDGVPRYLLSTSLMKLSCNRELVEPLFLFYFFRSPVGRHELLKNTSTVGTPGIATPLTSLRSIEVPLPPLTEQRAIAHILGTLDDKIELNRRMNETLEAMARALFKSWFVDFDPVRARRGDPCGRPREGRDKPCPYMTPEILSLFPDSFEDSELGEIPAGWRVDSLGNLIELQYGKALRQEDRRLGDVAVFGSNGQVGWHDERLVEGPGIVVGRKGNPGVATWVPTDFFPIDTTFYVVPKGECRSLHFLFYALKTHDLALLGADSAVPGLNRNLAYMSQQIVPSRLILETFDSLVQPLYQRIYQAEDESRTLAALRDTLLPKLLSGEIRVKEAERILERHM